MRRAILCAAAAIVSVHACSSPGLGQGVWVGPGFVRAPYASIDWFPNGAARVKAPFVSVYSPGFPWAPPFPVPPPFPWMVRSPSANPADRVAAETEPRQLDWGSLRRGVAQSTAALDFELGALQTGDLWKAHLKTAELAALVRGSRQTPPNEEERPRLQGIYEIHQSVGQSPEYRMISDKQSFQALGAMLGEYLTTPDERLRRDLLLAAGELSRSLEQFRTGDTWQQYLEVAPGQSLSPDPLNQATTAATTSELATALARFDSVRRNDNYRVIAAVPEFKQMHALLATYLSQARTSSPAGIEELPVPRPAAVR